MNGLSRNEHVQWSKERALEYITNGDLVNGYTSMVSDLKAHPETKNHPDIELGLALMMTGKLSTQHEMKKFIEGFN